VGKGDRVGIFASNGIHWYTAFFGTLKLGAIVVPINVRLVTAELGPVLDKVGCKVVVTDADRGPELMKALGLDERTIVVQIGGGQALPSALPVDQILGGHERIRFADVSPGDPAVIALTSGTTGAPKLVLHTLASLKSALAGQPRRGSREPIVWSTFYDIRRYGGLQIFLRAVHAGSLVLSDPAEPATDFLARAAAAGVTHISGTPSHWRRALMSGAATRITPRYVRLSGEIADQGVLDSLHAAYPEATIAHAFASTEAGVAFEVRDALAGFPTQLIGAPGPVQLRLVEETLQIRSAGNAERYLGENVEPLKTADGWVDTGDRMEERAGRYHFVGRRGGVINVGGLKVHPEEVEAVINAHPRVRMSLVRARRNAITGAVVVADVVLAEEAHGEGGQPGADTLARELTESCRRALAPHKVPAMIRIVPALEMSAAGKLVRPLA